MKILGVFAALSVFFWTSQSWADDPVCTTGTCVPKADLDKFVAVLKEKQCLQTTKPTFELDPINIIVDKDGRVFYSGAAPNPYTLRMKWCNYEADGQGKVNLVTALRVPSIWGFRFRPKAYMGLLPIEAFNIEVSNEAKKLAGQKTDSLTFSDVWDAGVMVDFFHYDWFNVNAAVGFRSFGAGIGADLTQNFGIYVGYAETWATWHPNVNVGLWFSFWNP